MEDLLKEDSYVSLTCFGKLGCIGLGGHIRAQSKTMDDMQVANEVMDFTTL